MKVPRMEPCGTPAEILPEAEDLPCRTVRCWRLDRELLRRLYRLPKMSHLRNLVRSLVYHTRSNALEMSS